MVLQVNAAGFVYDPEGKVWFPPLNPKQFEVFEDRHRFLLATGPRKSGKSFSLIHKILRHAFDVNGAIAAIICKTMKNAKSAGVWALLCRLIPIWERECWGFRIVEGPKTTGDTKMSFIKIRNRHGTISEIQCHSLEHASEVEEKFKGTAYSFLWLSELDQYCDQHAFDILCDTLRMTPFIPFEEHQLVADCNPPDTGPNNWIHDLWFKFKESKPTEDEGEDGVIARGYLHRILVMIDDNPQLDPKEKRELIARYRKRKALFNRFILGLWEQDITDGHFSEVWDETIHVVGKSDGPPEEHECLIPTANCTSLLTGWDLGESMNHSFHILEKIANEAQVQDPATGRMIPVTLVSFSVIDELVVIKTKISLNEFVEAAMEKMERWAGFQRKTRNLDIQFRHWSDTSALRHRSLTNCSEMAMVYEASDGQIVLQGAPRYNHSRRDRVSLIWELLHDKRLHISAQLAKTKLMFANLRKGTTQTEYIKEDEHKHPFDSLSYPIIAEAPIDMLRSNNPVTAAREAINGIVVARV